MNTERFSDAMCELDEKYIMEAATYKATKKNTVYTVMARAACLFFAFALAGGSFLTLNVEARAAFIGWVRSQYEVFHVYRFEGDYTNTNPLQYTPGWMPEGSRLLTVLDNGDGETYIYTDDEDFLISFMYNSDPGSSALFTDTVDYEYIKADVNGIPADVYISSSEDETSGIIWIDDDTHTLFSISGPYDKDTLVRMAEDIRVKD